jgi:hypothetical protein
MVKLMRSRWLDLRSHGRNPEEPQDKVFIFELIAPIMAAILTSGRQHGSPLTCCSSRI